jgi:hypothetical protein
MQHPLPPSLKQRNPLFAEVNPMSDLIKTTALTPTQQRQLQHHEALITKGMGDVYNSIKLIHDQGLFKGTHETWAEYVRDRWGIGQSRAYHILKHGQILRLIEDKDSAIAENLRESHTREVADLPPKEAAKIIMDTVQRTDGKITAQAVRETREGDPFDTEVEGEEADPFGDEPISPEGDDAKEDSNPRPPRNGKDQPGASKEPILIDPQKAFKTQRAKTIKTVEALGRAFDDLHRLHKSPSDHESVLAWCKQLLTKARNWQ